MLYYHTQEIKSRILYSFISITINTIILWEYKQKILFNLSDFNLIYTSIPAAFYTYLYFVIFMSLVWNLPYLYLHYYSFKLPGIYHYQINRKFYLIWFLFIILFKKSLDLLALFFTSFESDYLKIALTIDNFVLFLINISILLIFILTLPYFIKYLKIGRKLLYLLLTLILALLTPPDIFSLLITLIPLILVCEIVFFIDYYV